MAGMETVEPDFPFVFPINGYIPSVYGGPGSPASHQGYDLKGLTDLEPVYAGHSGWLTNSTSTLDNCTPEGSGGGRQVIIDHGGGSAGFNSVYTRYHHLSSYALPTNTWVAAGDLIGYQGISGRSNCAYHLHWEFRRTPSSLNTFLRHLDIPTGVHTNITAGSPIAFDGWLKGTTTADWQAEYFVKFGQTGDIPILGDWNGDGRDTPGFVRVIQSGVNIGQYEWYMSDTPISASSSGTELAQHSGPFRWGGRGDKVVIGDWNGDNVDSPGIVRVDQPGVFNSLTTFWLTNVRTGNGVDSYRTQSWGSYPGRYPVVGDWNGNSFDTAGIYYVPTAEWFLTNSVLTTGAPLDYSPFSWGQPADIPLKGDWLTNNFDRPIVYQKWLNNYQQAMTWHRASTVPPSGGLNSFGYGGLGEYPMVANFDTDALDEYVLAY